MEKSKRKVKNKNRPIYGKLSFWLLIVLVMFLLLGTVFLISLGRQQREAQFVALSESRSHAESLLRSDLPEQATHFHIASFTLYDPTAWIRFEIPSALGLDWTAEAPCFETFTRDPAWLYTPLPYDIEWWQPQDAETLLVSSCVADTLYNMFIDQTDLDTWIVYIQVQI